MKLSVLGRNIRKLFELIINKVGEGNSSHDFSLNSGERQTAKTMEDIRYDHRTRYELCIEIISNISGAKSDLFGLDAFCGTGYGTDMLSKELHCIMIGIDGSDEAIDFANRYYSNNTTFYSYKKFPFHLPPNTFDFIVCYESLEHVDDGVFFIKQIIDALKTDGYLIISTPNEECFSHNKNFNKFHYKHYTMKELVDLIHNSGNLQLLKWFGQNLYYIENGKVSGTLPENKMGLIEEQEGQLLILVLKKSDGNER